MLYVPPIVQGAIHTHKLISEQTSITASEYHIELIQQILMANRTDYLTGLFVEEVESALKDCKVDLTARTVVRGDILQALKAAVLTFRKRLVFDRIAKFAKEYKNECDRWGAALSAYNGGLGWHNKRRGRAEDPQDFWGSVRGINPGITDGNQRENFDYPHKIIFKHQPQFVRVGDKKICIN